MLAWKHLKPACCITVGAEDLPKAMGVRTAYMLQSLRPICANADAGVVGRKSASMIFKSEEAFRVVLHVSSYLEPFGYSAVHKAHEMFFTKNLNHLLLGGHGRETFRNRLPNLPTNAHRKDETEAPCIGRIWQICISMSIFISDPSAHDACFKRDQLQIGAPHQNMHACVRGLQEISYTRPWEPRRRGGNSTARKSHCFA